MAQNLQQSTKVANEEIERLQEYENHIVSAKQYDLCEKNDNDICNEEGKEDM